MSLWKKLSKACTRTNNTSKPELKNSTTTSIGVQTETSDPLLWSNDLDQHCYGEFSMAVVQANTLQQDHSKVETWTSDTVIGIYDGHRSPEAAEFVRDNLFHHLRSIAEEEGEISEGVLRRSIHAIEEEFMAYVESKMEENPMITASGTCCLLGVISGNELFLAQVGDSRAVMGVYDRSTDDMFPVQLTQDHNVCDAELRGRMWSHHHDPNVVFVRRGCWRVRGMVQANRSIGDAYLKLPELTVAPKHEMYELHAPLRRGVVSGEPCVERRELGMEDRYVIFGTNGLWDLISNEDAVEIVRRNERKGIAKKLVSFALMKAAWEAGMEERELWNLNAGARRHFHDDITVVVVFIDGEMFERPRLLPWLCVTGGVGSEVGSVLGVWGDD